jgi:hypothetical protein
MDEDKEVGIRDTAEALAMLHASRVDVIFASHEHEYVEFEQEGIRSFITGGLGAPIARNVSTGAKGVHHVLVVDVREKSLDVTMVPFEGPTRVAKSDEDEGKE